MAPTLLVPIDGSPFSEQALPTALSLARRTGARVHLVRVHEPLIAMPPYGGLPTYDPEWEHELRIQEEMHLHSLAARVEEGAGVQVRTEVLDGPVVDTLSEYAADMHVDLVVMTTHGRGGLSRAWLGSVADGLVRRITRPVLLLRPEEEEIEPIDASRAPALDHILVPTDGSAFSLQILEPVLALARPLDARLTLLRVVTPTYGAAWVDPALPSLPEPAFVEMRERAEKELEAAAESIDIDREKVETAVMEYDSAAAGIIEYAKRHDVGMIAMTTHGRGGWQRIALGSVADKVLRGTDTPLLLYRPVQEAPGE